MKRLAIAAFVAALMVAPFTAQADDIHDAQECREGTAEPVALGAVEGEDADRGSFCVHADGFTALYVGGEAQAEEEPGTGGACGTIIILDENVTGEEDWDSDGGTPNDPSDDTHCD